MAFYFYINKDEPLVFATSLLIAPFSLRTIHGKQWQIANF